MTISVHSELDGSMPKLLLNISRRFLSPFSQGLFFPFNPEALAVEKFEQFSEDNDNACLVKFPEGNIG